MSSFGGPKRNPKRDANEPEIFGTLRAHGIQVVPTNKPFDAILGFRGLTMLLEVKNGPKAPLTVAQAEFMAQWRGSPVVVLDSQPQAMAWAKQLRELVPHHIDPQGIYEIPLVGTATAGRIIPK